MIRLTETDEQGNWALKGVVWKSLHVGQVITKKRAKSSMVRCTSLKIMRTVGCHQMRWKR